MVFGGDVPNLIASGNGRIVVTNYFGVMVVSEDNGLSWTEIPDDPTAHGVNRRHNMMDLWYEPSTDTFVAVSNTNAFVASADLETWQTEKYSGAGTYLTAFHIENDPDDWSVAEPNAGHPYLDLFKAASFPLTIDRVNNHWAPYANGWPYTCNL